MHCTMAAGKSVRSFLLVLASTCVFSHASPSEGRKLFGGYRIVPKACQPTITSRLKSNEPPICMFNYECTRRKGEVVGACMDGFLFGACCQLPPKTVISNPFEKIPSEDWIHIHEIDRVPDIPILLNSDGSPIGLTMSKPSTTVRPFPGITQPQLNQKETIYYTKISTITPSSSTARPPLDFYNHDVYQNAEKPQIPPQPDITNLEEKFGSLLGQQSVLDDLRLPGLLTHSDSNNDIQENQDISAVNPVTTLLSPDQILQIADPVDQLPALFSQGLSQNSNVNADTILLNENGTMLNESNNPDEIFRPTATDASTRTTELRTTQSASTLDATKATPVTMTTERKPDYTYHTNVNQNPTTYWSKSTEEPTFVTAAETLPQKLSTKPPVITQMYASTQKLVAAASSQATTHMTEKTTTIQERVSIKDLLSTLSQRITTPMTTITDEKEELVRVPTITYDVQSGNKKDDVTDKEEIAINHIISILNNTTPGSESSATIHGPTSSIHTWVSIDETSKPSSVKLTTSKLSSSTPFPYTYYRPAQPSTYYNYETVPTETSYSSTSFSARPSTQGAYGSSSSFGYSSRPTTNPPAPTVIVLGPLDTEYTTDTTEKTVVTKKPAFTLLDTIKSTFGTSTKTNSEVMRPTPSTVKLTSLSTKKPSVSTTITHNISTVISNVATSSNHLVSTSYISVNLKDGTSTRPTVVSDVSTEAVVQDTKEKEKVSSTRRPTIWTTLSSWSDKPSFFPKPTSNDFVWPESSNAGHISDAVVFKEPHRTTTAIPISPTCDEETAAPDDLSNFPPVRNPNLNISTPISQQEKPTIVETYNNTGYPDIEILSENDIPTPTFIEDDVLTNKVDAFVNKIVESLQGNFQDLKDIVYSRVNATSSAPSTATKRPTGTSNTTKKPARRPSTTVKPSGTTTKKPGTTRRPTSRPASQKPPSEKPSRPKPTTTRPKPTSSAQSVTTKRPQVTTKRPRPTRKPTTAPSTSTEAVFLEETSSTVESTAESTSASSDTGSEPNFRTQCGIRPLVKSGRIVGGKAAQFGEWPWQVLVREATWLGLFTKNKCGGVLITDKFVITAAHCQPGFLASLVAVFGEHDISGEREEKRSLTRNVRRVIVNRGYDPATFENDLALLELESPVQFDAHIVPICMPEDGSDFTGRMATVTGWGRLKYNGGVPAVLQEVQVPIMENSVCQEMFQTAGHSKLILDSFLCAGYANGQKDSCEGDSGGPLVMERPDGRWILVGTVSHGIKCAAPYLPGVYMKTTYFKPWLHSITGV